MVMICNRENYFKTSNNAGNKPEKALRYSKRLIHGRA